MIKPTWIIGFVVVIVVAILLFYPVGGGESYYESWQNPQPTDAISISEFYDIADNDD